jgi:ATP-dependent Zn protease
LTYPLRSTSVAQAEEGRRAILDIHVKNVPLQAGVDLDQVAAGTPGFSGARATR